MSVSAFPPTPLRELLDREGVTVTRLALAAGVSVPHAYGQVSGTRTLSRAVLNTLSNAGHDVSALVVATANWRLARRAEAEAALAAQAQGAVR